MRIGIHQPENLPWLGFFDRVRNVDSFVILDHVQFRKNNFQNRNRISNQKKEICEWLTTPISAGNDKSIKEIRVEPKEIWQRSYLEKIRHNYSKSSFYDEIFSLIQNSLNQKSDRLLDINMHFIQSTLKYLGINTTIFRSSELQLENTKSAMLVEICQKLGGDVYVTGMGAIDYLDGEEFAKQNISVRLRDPISEYTKYTFKGIRLSIVDALMREGSHLRNSMNRLEITEEVYV